MAPRKEESDNARFGIDDGINKNEDFEKPTKKIEKVQNGSIQLELGEYRALKLILTIFGISMCIYPIIWQYTPDPRMDNLPLMGSIAPSIIICLLYFCFSLVWGPRLMENRAPIRLKRTKIVYNLVQVVICTYTFIQASRLGWLYDYSYTCQPIDRSPEGVPFEITRAVYVYYLTKMLDLLDTVFFVLDKKWTNITFLHVGHHGGLVVGMYIGCRYSPGGHGTFIGFVNSFIHVLMYTYYLLAAMGPAVKPYLWWKKYLTILQLAQFVLIFLHALQVFFIDCPIQKEFQFFSCIYAVIIFYLFMDFYMGTYRSKKVTKKSSLENSNTIEMKSNGIHKNLTNDKELKSD